MFALLLVLIQRQDERKLVNGLLHNLKLNDIGTFLFPRCVTFAILTALVVAPVE